MTAFRLGKAECARRLDGQIQYLDRRVTEIVDAIDRSGRPGVIVLFSDHGSGVRFDADNQLDGGSDLDLRSANLLAVRCLGALDDRSTLVNILPRITAQIFGTPFEPVAEDIRVLVDDDARFVTILRPD